MNLIQTGLITLLFISSVSINPQKISDKPVFTTKEAPKMLQVERIAPIPTPEQLALINLKATQYNVSPEIMKKVIACESGYDEDVQSRHITKDGTREESYGLVQINLPSHPSVSYEQAINKEFAVDFLAKNLSEGNGRIWSCYNMFYPNGSS